MPTRFRLKEALEQSNMSQAEVARLSGLGLATVSRMCRFPTRSETLEILDRLSAVLRIEPNDLITRAPMIERSSQKRGPGRPRRTSPHSRGDTRVGIKWTRQPVADREEESETSERQGL